MESKNNQIINRNDKSSSPGREIRQVFNDLVGKLLPNGQGSDISEHSNQNQKSNDSGSTNSDAIFIGWQKKSSGEVFPLYNVTVENHPLYRSTVSEQTLRNQNLKIPETPLTPSNEKRTGNEK